MKFKKGMLLTEEVLKMIIAVIGLVLLSYFLISFFYSDAKAKKQKEALSSLDEISQIIANIGVSGGNVTVLQTQSWTLFGFINENKKPNSCSGQACLCICPDVLADFFDRQIKKCDKTGACLVVSNLEDFKDIKIQPYKKETTNININELNGKIYITKI